MAIKGRGTLQQRANLDICLLAKSKILQRFLIFLTGMAILGMLLTYKVVVFNRSPQETPEDYDSYGDHLDRELREEQATESTPNENAEEVPHENAEGIPHDNAEEVSHENAEGIPHENAEGIPHENAGVSHENAEGFPHENAEGFPHENAEGVPHENAEGFPHEKAEGVPHENAEGVLHENAEGVPHENAEAIPHENADGVPHENAEGVPHENAEGIPHDNVEGIPHKNAEGIPHDNSEAIPHENAEAIPHENAEAIPHDNAEAIPHENAEGIPHENAEGIPHENAEGVPHENAETIPHENAEGVPHENAEGIPHENAEAIPHENAEGIPHENAEGIPHENAEGIPHENAEGVPHENAEGIPHDNSEAIPHENAEGIPHENAEAIPLGFNIKSFNVSTKPIVTTNSFNLTAKLLVSTKAFNVTPKQIIKTKLFNVTTRPQSVTTNNFKEKTKAHDVPGRLSIVTAKSPNLVTVGHNVAKKSSDVIIKNYNLTMMFKANTTALSKPIKLQKPTLPPLDYGDTYTMDDTYLKSTCPKRTRDTLRTGEFKDAFLDTIPVLQWKKYANVSEYQRLQKYGGAFGWSGVTWDIVNETLNLLNASNGGYLFDNWKGRRPCVRCAVLGNGGIMNGSGMGKEIDAHDYVFRVNGAITKGFEKDVGNRTSFFFFSTNTLMNSLTAYGRQGFKQVPRSEETRFLLLPDHDRDYLLVRAALTNSTIDRGKDKSRIPARYFGQHLTTEHFKILHPDFMRYLRNRFLWSPILKTKFRNIYRPSTGAAMLLAAVHTCDEVNAYGFMTPNYAKFSDHYYDAKYKKVVFYANHSFRKEMEVWQNLHKAGVIKLYMRNGDSNPQEQAYNQRT
ncbi:alpha-N-acetylgalactosaminide alpha-2,6-sialyltransferase 2-like [Pelobates cultripes]|uniref:alpha-N-acetylgalactosaminide alpha-2,6-sialyltransferase n=1 Tax=Pelobates cultripes TaxID=61616 RepID=A0AAD1S4Z3_PELCU|nr:alpha-N-acetylgalactosaminide alpha-2,6-sialyltransferase 2-like [Pelobates cultripes]